MIKPYVSRIYDPDAWANYRWYSKHSAWWITVLFDKMGLKLDREWRKNKDGNNNNKSI